MMCEKRGRGRGLVAPAFLFFLTLFTQRRRSGILRSSYLASCITPVQHVEASLADVLVCPGKRDSSGSAGFGDSVPYDLTDKEKAADHIL
jgi:hypothetical protein